MNTETCIRCGDPVSRPGAKYCTRICVNRHRFDESIRRWYDGASLNIKTIRKHLLEKHDNKCTQCGWGEINPHSKVSTPPLEVEHKDGNYRNNHPDNLDLLCPNCHSLTPTFKGLNVGNGRPYDKHR